MGRGRKPPARSEQLWVPDGPTGYEVWSVGGHLTEVLHIPATQPGPVRNVLVFIPGNPGLVGHYHDYLETLHRLSGGNIEVFGCTYPGQSQYLANHEQRVLSLDEQVQHKIAFYDAVSERVGANEPQVPITSSARKRRSGMNNKTAKSIRQQPRVFLAGHSLGVYVCLQILKERPDARIEKVLGLFPTLHSMGSTPRGRQASWLLMPGVRHVLCGVALALRSVLPASRFLDMVRKATGQSGRQLSATTQLIHLAPLSSWMYLAACEMSDIREMQHDAFSRHADKFILYYGVNDGWCPQSHYDEIRRLYPETETHLCQLGVPHAFVARHSEAIAGQSARLLQPHLQ